MIILKKLEWGIVGFFVGLIILTYFWKPINDFADLIPEEEWRIIAKITLVILFLCITTFLPIGLFTQDTVTNYAN